MSNNSGNKMLFIIFIFVILLILSILVIAVYNSKNKVVEEYKISLNNALYDENYSYVDLKNDSLLKKEWDGKYYLYENGTSNKYSLGNNTVIYDKSIQEITIYGTVYQIFTNNEVIEKNTKTTISNTNDFEFFKLSDRKYLIIGENIIGEKFSTTHYLMVSIDKAGNALLLNNSVNIKTINPLTLTIGKVKFDIANEKLLYNDTEIDLKKVNGSTNEYEKKDDTLVDNSSNKEESTSNNNDSDNVTSNNTSNQSEIYNQIVNQIINLSGLVSGVTSNNSTTLYKNVSLRGIKTGSTYFDVNYSVVDPENKYTSIYLTLTNSDDNNTKYFLSKDSTLYRISGLQPNTRYTVDLSYFDGTTVTTTDSMTVLTDSDPTQVRIAKKSGNIITYQVKMYNEYIISSAKVALYSCDSSNYELLDSKDLNIDNALSASGDNNTLIYDAAANYTCLYLKIDDAKFSDGSIATVNSYHKIRI